MISNISKLEDAIVGYDFPMVAYDFSASEEISSFASYSELELYIKEQLTSENLNSVKDGLSNVLYWGYATSKGRQKDRVNKFRLLVNNDQLRSFSNISNNHTITLSEIKKIGLPQFSGISFISKILMFINPRKYVTLDLQLKKIQDSETKTFYQELTSYPTSLPINKKNEEFYKKWCDYCSFVAKEKVSISARAVDIERAIFSIVRTNGADDAAQIIIDTAA